MYFKTSFGKKEVNIACDDILPQVNYLNCEEWIYEL